MLAHTLAEGYPRHTGRKAVSDRAQLLSEASWNGEDVLDDGSGHFGRVTDGSMERRVEREMDRAVGREIYGGQIKGVRRQASAGLWRKGNVRMRGWARWRVAFPAHWQLLHAAVIASSYQPVRGVFSLAVIGPRVLICRI